LKVDWKIIFARKARKSDASHKKDLAPCAHFLVHSVIANESEILDMIFFLNGTLGCDYVQLAASVHGVITQSYLILIEFFRPLEFFII
jgi:hypothetical protein